MASSNAETIKNLKLKRTAFKAQLTRFRKTLETYDGGLEELKHKTERLADNFKQFDEGQSALDLMEEAFDHQEERFEVADTFDSLIGKARDLIRDREPSTHREPGSQSETESHARRSPSVPHNDESEIQLPRIQLPKFSGSYEDWPGFADQFNSAVHDNKSLNDSKRLTYLRSCLVGEAAKSVESLGTSASNYLVAWSILETRYNKPSVIINQHLKALFEMPRAHKPSYTDITNYLNIAESRTKALKTINSPDEDPILLYLLASKMDPITGLKWRETCQTRPRIMLKDLFEFMHSQRCVVLPSEHEPRNLSKQSGPNKMYGHSSGRTAPNQVRAPDREAHAKPHYGLASVAKPQCTLCSAEHYPSSCQEFKDAAIDRRREMIKNANVCRNCLRSGHVAKDCRSGTCRKCNGKHHTLLHEDTRPTANAQANLYTLSAHSATNGLLSTAIVTIYDKDGQAYPCRALLDSGSQSHFLSKSVAEKLRLDLTRVQISVQGIHSAAKTITHAVKVHLESRRTKFVIDLSCLVLETLSHTLPTRYIDRKPLNIPKTIKLADPNFHKPGPIDLILGAEIYYKLLLVGKRPLANNSAALIRTELGWIVTGSVGNGPLRVSRCNLATHALDRSINKFWEIEEPPTPRILSNDETAAERHYKENTQRDPSTGRYIVRLPFRDNLSLGNSYTIALKRFYKLEKALAGNTDRKRLYVDFMNEYAALGHMSEQGKVDHNEGYYLPHHAVLKDNSNSTKLRVVFNGSARTTSGNSLNDTLMVGPTIQDDLFTLIIRFRTHAYVLTADVTKMYRQFLVHPEDRKFQRILWREHPTEPIKVFELNTVTYGTSAAPFLAIRSLHQLAEDEAAEYPTAATIVKRDFYVDDLLTGANTYHEARAIREDLINLTKKGGLELRKWASNDPRLIDTASSDDAIVKLEAIDSTSILGISWQPTRDTIRYSFKEPPDVTVPTKRSILSEIAQLFDPLGLIGPIIVHAKLIMQQLWQLRVGWDESVPMEIATMWAEYREQLPLLRDIVLPREILVKGHKKVQLHGFCDASEKAYGACIYLKSVNRQGDVTVRLVCSKSRVAPLKTISLPRLELCGAVLLMKLYSSITRALAHITVNKVWFWTDSTIVLSWIGTPCHTLKTFVANRVAEIQSVSIATQWRHVPSPENPADIISRSTMPAELKEKPIWQHGPSWLKFSEAEWPANMIHFTEIPEQRPVIAYVSSISNYDILSKYSSLKKLKRVIAYCRRFAINSSSSRTRQPRRSGALSVEELDDALDNIIRIVQREQFAHEIGALSSNGKLKGSVTSLNPFIDSTGILRVGGRISRSDLPYATKHPALLPRLHHLTELIIREVHEANYHAGVQATLAAIRENFWIVDGRTAVKRVVHRCVTCTCAKPVTPDYRMADLPRDRVTSGRPFSSAGVDYCGPIYIKEKRLRNKNKVKIYIAIFVCLATKAVHIEIVSDLTTEAFLAALRRFFARRGKSTQLYSDNATNFVGANREIRELYDMIREQHTHIESSLANDGIKWHFIPPRSPHFGGLWEAAVKSFKHHFTRVIGETLLAYEALHTFTTEIEAILNSRPLTPLSSDPNDLNPLTPAHFLIGGPLTSIPEHDFRDTNTSRLSMWQHVQKMKQHFWTRWHKEYLHELTVRRKWHSGQTKDLPIGTMVIVHEDNTPPIRWPLGRITDVHPGEDGVIRVATVRSANGTHKRPIKKLSPLLLDK